MQAGYGAGGRVLTGVRGKNLGEVRNKGLLDFDVVWGQGDDGARVGSGAGRAPATDALVIRPGSPAEAGGGGLVRVARTGAFCPCMKA